MTPPQLPAPLSGGAITQVPGEYAHLETVVETGFPVKYARQYLRRNLGNRVSVHLVAAGREEPVGVVRTVQVNLEAGGDPIFIRRVRTLPDGSIASPYVPDELVEVRAELVTMDGRPPQPLGPYDEVVLHVPVRSYMRFLPAAFQGGIAAPRPALVKADEVSASSWDTAGHETEAPPPPAPSDAMERHLFIYQHMMTTVIDKVADLSSLTDPLTCDPKFLSWIASWVGFTLDESLPLHQQRELVRRAIRLYRNRGTRAGMEEMIKVLTAAPVTVSAREKPQPFVLGAATLAGGHTVSDRYERSEPPAHYLYPSTRPATGYFTLVLERRDRFARRFSERAPDVLRRIAQVVTGEKPAHVTFTIRFDEQ